MSAVVVFHPAAEAEVNEAADFYDMESPGLGRSLLDEVEHAVGLVQAHPEASTVIQGKVRRKRLRKFPYSLLYVSAAEEVRILAVAHDRRRPYYWTRRR